MLTRANARCFDAAAYAIEILPNNEYTISEAR